MKRVPWWVFALAAALAAVEPLTHYWLMHAMPAGMAHSGFHIGDDPFFLTAMRAFREDFASPYATCDAPLPAHSWRYFALPHHWLYGGLGILAGALHISDFMMLAIANAVGGFFYLIAVYGFLSAILTTENTEGTEGALDRHAMEPITNVIPAKAGIQARLILLRRADIAFLLFALQGGLGGILYLVSWGLGTTRGAAFEGWFHRYARYDLIEGPFLAPLLVMPRLYYTLPLGLGFLALACMVRALRTQGGLVRVRTAGQRRPFAIVYFLIVAATLINARIGLLLLLVAACLLAASSISACVRTAWAVLIAASALPVLALVSALLGQNPHAADNVADLLRRCAWFGSLVAAAPFALLFLGVALRMAWPALPRWQRIICGAASGYLLCFAALYLAHQVYWGNLFRGGDTAAALAVSDWALLGAIAGAFAAWRLHSTHEDGANDSEALRGALLWAFLFLAVAISAWGKGRFLVFMPERFLVMLGVPLALVSAFALERVAGTRPHFARALFFVMLACGIASNAVGALCFQGPLGRRVDEPAFAWVHSEAIAPEDAAVLDTACRGTVLAPASLPPLMGDVVVQHTPGTRTVLGQPSLEFAGKDMRALMEEVRRFFDPAQIGGQYDHRAAVERCCVDYIFCPRTRPVDPRVVALLSVQPWLEQVAGENGAALFRVRR